MITRVYALEVCFKYCPFLFLYAFYMVFKNIENNRVFFSKYGLFFDKSFPIKLIALDTVHLSPYTRMEHDVTNWFLELLLTYKVLAPLSLNIL